MRTTALLAFTAAVASAEEYVAEDLQEWNYCKGSKCTLGRDQWADVYPECGSNRQSPINIKTKDAEKVKNKRLPNLNWLYGAPEEVDVLNTGNFLRISGFDNPTTLVGGPLGTLNYTLASVEIHWGKSEHKINGKRGSGEIHFIHRRTDLLNTGVDAELQNRGVAIIGAQISSNNKDPEVEKITSRIEELASAGSTISVEDFDVEELAPKKVEKKFYTYQGSFTYPPCTEGVTWIIAKEKTKMSGKQLKAMKNNLLNNEGETTKEPYRDDKKLGARGVFKSGSFGGGGGGGSNPLEDLLNGGDPFGGIDESLDQLF